MTACLLFEFLGCSPGPLFEAGLPARWSQRLASLAALDEMTSLQLMQDAGLPCVPFQLGENWSQVQAAAEVFGYPLVMKTAMPEIAHKSDQGGVRLGIGDAHQRSIQHIARLGARRRRAVAGD